jgi:hypothetical protein
MINRKNNGVRTDKLKCVEHECFETCVSNCEYYSPNQRGGIDGIVYRQYFADTLPAALTSGDPVSKLIDYALEVDDATDRHLLRGWSDNGTISGIIKLSGTSGYGNLSLSAVGVTVISGWVEYTK